MSEPKLVVRWKTCSCKKRKKTARFSPFSSHRPEIAFSNKRRDFIFLFQGAAQPKSRKKLTRSEQIAKKTAAHESIAAEIERTRAIRQSEDVKPLAFED